MSLTAFIAAAEERDLRVRVVREPDGDLQLRWMVMAEGDPLRGYVVSPIAFGPTADQAAGHLLRRLRQAGVLSPSPVETGEGDLGDAGAEIVRQSPASTAAGTNADGCRSDCFAVATAGVIQVFHQDGCPKARSAA